MTRFSSVIALLSLVLLVGSTTAAEKKQVKPTKQWNGSVADDKLMKDAPAVVVSAKEFEKLWKAWGIKDDVPKVDFDKELVVVTTTKGSRVNITCTLDGDDLKIGGYGTADFGEGFRYVIATVSKEGVKKVNGKDLPKE